MPFIFRCENCNDEKEYGSAFDCGSAHEPQLSCNECGIGVCENCSHPCSKCSERFCDDCLHGDEFCTDCDPAEEEGSVQ